MGKLCGHTKAAHRNSLGGPYKERRERNSSSARGKAAFLLRRKTIFPSCRVGKEPITRQKKGGSRRRPIAQEGKLMFTCKKRAVISSRSTDQNTDCQS